MQQYWSSSGGRPRRRSSLSGTSAAGYETMLAGRAPSAQVYFRSVGRRRRQASEHQLISTVGLEGAMDDQIYWMKNYATGKDAPRGAIRLYQIVAPVERTVLEEVFLDLVPYETISCASARISPVERRCNCVDIFAPWACLTHSLPSPTAAASSLHQDRSSRSRRHSEQELLVQEPRCAWNPFSLLDVL